MSPSMQCFNALAFAWPLHTSKTSLAAITVPMPTVNACFGTKSRLPSKKRLLAWIVSVVNVLTRVLDANEEPGSLNARCPSGPIPPKGQRGQVSVLTPLIILM